MMSEKTPKSAEEGSQEMKQTELPEWARALLGKAEEPRPLKDFLEQARGGIQALSEVLGKEPPAKDK